MHGIEAAYRRDVGIRFAADKLGVAKLHFQLFGVADGEGFDTLGIAVLVGSNARGGETVPFQIPLALFDQDLDGISNVDVDVFGVPLGVLVELGCRLGTFLLGLGGIETNKVVFLAIVQV